MKRRGLALLGGLVLSVAWLGPLPTLAREAFTAHMTMHMAVVAVAAPLLALGLAGGALDPVRRRPALLAPVPVSVLELVVVWGWHAPALHHAARGSAGVMALEQGSFLVTGLLVWLAAFGGDPRDRPRRAGAGIAGLLLTSMHMTLLGALLGLAGRTLYRHPGPGPWGMSPLEDQQMGGVIMLLVGGAVYLAGGMALTATLLRGAGAATREGAGTRRGAADGASVEAA